MQEYRMGEKRRYLSIVSRQLKTGIVCVQWNLMNNGHFGTNINVLFKRFQSHYIDRGDEIWDLVLSIVERYLIQCPFLGVSVKRDSTVLLVPSIFHLVPLEHNYKNLAHIANFCSFNFTIKIRLALFFKF